MDVAAITTRLVGTLLASVGMLAATAGAVDTGTASFSLPPPAAPADYQLGGGYPLPSGVKIVSRDRTDIAAAGAYNVCYLNSFQTQPEETSWWRAHHPEVLLRKRGRLVGDANWPGEVLFDIRTVTKRRTLLRVQGAWIGGCAKKRFAAIEPDNLDSYTRSRGLLTRSDAIAMASLLTGSAHRRGLAIAQKNTAELAPSGRRIGFDFAVAEECQVYRECDAYTGVYGRRVVEIEYTDNGIKTFRAACKARDGRASIVLRDRNLTRPGNPAYVDQRC